MPTQKHIGYSFDAERNPAKCHAYQERKFEETEQMVYQYEASLQSLQSCFAAKKNRNNFDSTIHKRFQYSAKPRFVKIESSIQLAILICTRFSLE